MRDIQYYPQGSGGPVAEYLEYLARERPKAFARLVLDLELLGAEGPRCQHITVRPLGDKLWELKRLYDGTHYRVFFGLVQDSVWLLHSIEKKSAKTPQDDLELARRRLKAVRAR